MIFVLLGWLIVWLVKLNQRINHQSCWRFNSSLQRALSCLPYTIPTSSNKRETRNKRNTWISNQYLPALAPHTPHPHIRPGRFDLQWETSAFPCPWTERSRASRKDYSEIECYPLTARVQSTCIYKYMRMYNVYTVYWNYIIYFILSSKIT